MNMKKIRVLIIALALLPASLSLAPLGAISASHGVMHPRMTHLYHGESTNWSGYAVETNLAAPASNAVTNVSGQWTVPVVSCTSQTAYSSIWVGIDGYSDDTVQQTGTEQDCRNGRPNYYAWYEMYPQSSYKIGMTIRAGDVMTASVHYISGTTYALTITDLTSNRHYTTTRTVRGALRQSAEWVVEAPSSFFGVLPLANYGTATITNASATINGLTSNIAEPTWQNDPITMLTTTSPQVPRSTPSALSPDGTSFSTTWSHL